MTVTINENILYLIHVISNPGLPWQKQHSTGITLFSPANYTSSSLGPVSLCPGCTSAFGLLYSPKYSNQHRFNSPVPLCCANICWFDKWVPKDIIALASQRLAAADNMLHCFSLLPAASAGRIPFTQAHDIQVPSYRSLSCEDRS
jgi:hypothetical protein